MDTARSSLHYQVEKWLRPEPSDCVRVARFGHMADGTRYVQIAATRINGHRELYFFRHDDGDWCVFPQRSRQPTMSAYRFTQAC